MIKVKQAALCKQGSIYFTTLEIKFNSPIPLFSSLLFINIIPLQSFSALPLLASLTLLLLRHLLSSSFPLLLRHLLSLFCCSVFFFVLLSPLSFLSPPPAVLQELEPCHQSSNCFPCVCFTLSMPLSAAGPRQNLLVVPGKAGQGQIVRSAPPNKLLPCAMLHGAHD